MRSSKTALRENRLASRCPTAATLPASWNLKLDAAKSDEPDSEVAAQYRQFYHTVLNRLSR
jgi:hypothetical protein